MPIQSKYSNAEIETLITEILLVLEQKNCSVDLSLMALGNTITHLISNEVSPANRQTITMSFCQALQNSVPSDSKVQ